MSGRIPSGHIGITDPPSKPLHEQWVCLEHGPTVRVLWTAGMRCPLCESYERERELPAGAGRAGGASMRPQQLADWPDATDCGSPAKRPRWHLRPDLVDPPEGFRVIVDTREQAPYFVGRAWAERGTLKTGDYSLAGYQDRVCVERKSLPDAFGSYGRGRERFEREHERLRDMDSAILIESSYAGLLDPHGQDHPRLLLAGVLEALRFEDHPEAPKIKQVLRELGWWHPGRPWPSRVKPASVEGSLLAWSHRYGVQILLASSRRLGERLTFRWLATWWLEQQT